MNCRGEKYENKKGERVNSNFVSLVLFSSYGRCHKIMVVNNVMLSSDYINSRLICITCSRVLHFLSKLSWSWSLVNR